MVETFAIFGEAACRRYEDTGKLPTEYWLKRNDGQVRYFIFNTKGEYDAFVRGMNNTIGCQNAQVVQGKFIKTPQCKHCDHWQSFFSDKEGKVFCPDCGRMLFEESPKSMIEFDSTQYPIRTVFMSEMNRNITLGTTALNNLLLVDGNYISEEARQVDEQIFAYLSDEEMRFPDEDLIIFINDNIL